MFTYKANWLRSIWIYVASLSIIAYTIFLSLVVARFSKPNRARVDRWIRDWARRITNVVKIHYSVYFESPLHWEEHRRYLILSNHASLYDIPLIYLAMPGSIRMLSKKELIQIPLFGHAMLKNEFLSIDRNNRKQAIKDLEIAKAKLQDGIRLWIAPEGTRSRKGKLLTFKKGAFILALQTNAIIIPVGIRGSNKVLPAKTLNFNLNQEVEVHIGKPIDTQHYTSETRDLLIEEVRKAIARLANVPFEEEAITHEKPKYNNPAVHSQHE